MPDGRQVCLRPIREDDEPQHYDLLAHVSPEDRRFRFFAVVRTMSDETMARFTHIDYDREMAFIASAETDDGEHETLGVVRTIADDDGKEAEFAIVVRSDLKHHGIGHALMDKAIRYCRERGIECLKGQVLSDNTSMIGFARSHGFSTRSFYEEGVVEIELVLAPP